MSNEMKKVFLGGTWNESTWRDRMMIYLSGQDLGYFNPIVESWNEKAQENEIRERKECDFCLYAITPKMTGIYSIAEVVDDSNKRPDKTVLVLLRSDDGESFTEDQWKSLNAVGRLVQSNGGGVFDHLHHAAIAMGNIAKLG